MIDYYFGVRETNQNSSDAGIKSEPTVEEHYLTLISNRLLKYVAPYINNQPYAGAKTYIDYTIVRLGLKPLANVRPLRPELAMIVVNDVIAFKYPINIPKCRDANKSTTANRTLWNRNTSASHYFEKRQIIRVTWLRHIRDLHYHRGLLGSRRLRLRRGANNESHRKKREQEPRRYFTSGNERQLSQFDAESGAILNWANSNCAHVHFVISSSDGRRWVCQRAKYGQRFSRIDT